MWISGLDSLLRLSEPRSARDSPVSGHPRPRPRLRPRHDARRVSSRTRRRLVASLRRIADRASSRDPVRRRFEVLLLDRAAPVRGDLLEIATLLEDAPRPDHVAVGLLRGLLTDGCESPLYNPDVHPSELRATLYVVRSRLAAAREP
jgi:hypothetical protein